MRLICRARLRLLSPHAGHEPPLLYASSATLLCNPPSSATRAGVRGQGFRLQSYDAVRPGDHLPVLAVQPAPPPGDKFPPAVGQDCSWGFRTVQQLREPGLLGRPSLRGDARAGHRDARAGRGDARAARGLAGEGRVREGERTTSFLTPGGVGLPSGLPSHTNRVEPSRAEPRPARVVSARLGSARCGTARLGAARLDSALRERANLYLS